MSCINITKKNLGCCYSEVRPVHVCQRWREDGGSSSSTSSSAGPSSSMPWIRQCSQIPPLKKNLIKQYREAFPQWDGMLLLHTLFKHRLLLQTEEQAIGETLFFCLFCFQFKKKKRQFNSKKHPIYGVQSDCRMNHNH